MTAHKPRFEVVHTGPHQFHARFRAGNGQVVWVTESYRRRRTAQHAIKVLAASIEWSDKIGTWPEVDERLPKVPAAPVTARIMPAIQTMTASTANASPAWSTLR